MPERIFKSATVRSIEDIETEIVDAFAAKSGDADLMVIEVDDEEYLPLFHEALSNTKQLFFDVNCLPVIRVNPATAQSYLVLALVALALQEALNYYATPADREEMIDALFNNAALILRNTPPELVADLITKEFDGQILSFLAKS